MPKYNPRDRSVLLASSSFVQVDGARIYPPDWPTWSATGRDWYDADTILTGTFKVEGGASHDVLLIDRQGHPVGEPLLHVLVPGGVNRFCGGGRRWAAVFYRAPGGGETVIDGQLVSGISPISFSDDGWLAYATLPSGLGLRLCPPGRLPSADDLELQPPHVWVDDVTHHGNGAVIYRTADGIHAHGMPDWPAQIVTTIAAVGHLVPFRWQGRWWLFYQEQDRPSRVVCHPADEIVGFHLADYVPGRQEFHRPDAAVQPDDSLRLAWALFDNDDAGTYQADPLTPASPRVDLRPPPPPPPPPPPFVPRPLSPARVDDGTFVDLLPYYLGRADTWPRKGPDHEMNQVMGANGLFYFVKFADATAYEVQGHDANGFYHFGDWSFKEGNRFLDPRWFPRFMRIGEAFAFVVEHVTEFLDRACRVLRREKWRRRMWLQTVYDAYDWGPDLGVRATAVLAYDPTFGAHVRGRWVELGFFALDAGSCLWQSHHADLVYPKGYSQPAIFTEATRDANKGFYLIGGPDTQPALTGCDPLTIPHYPPWSIPKEGDLMFFSQFVDPSKGLLAVKAIKPVAGAPGISTLILPDDRVFSVQPDGSDGDRDPGADGGYERCRVSGNVATFKPADRYFTRAFVVVEGL